MAAGRHKQRLASAETLLLGFAIWERKSAVHIILKNSDAVGMRVHHRLFMRSVVDAEHPHLGIFDFDLVMMGVNFYGVLNFLAFGGGRHESLLCCGNTLRGSERRAGD